jgi:hypothetical protein
MSKIKIILILLGCLLFTGLARADDQRKIVLDATGNLHHFWIISTTEESNQLQHSKSIDQGSSFDQPQTLYAFTREVTSFDIQANQNNFLFAFTTGEALYLTHSTDYGQTFSAPLLFSERSKNPSLAVKNDLVVMAWEEDGIIKICSSEGEVLHFDEPRSLIITGEALSSPALLIDNSSNIHLCFLSKDPNNLLNKILYAKLDGTEPKEIFQSLDDLIGLKIQETSWGLLFSWQKSYFGRYESYLCPSFDFGNNFGKINILPIEKEVLAILFKADKPVLATYDYALSFEEVDFTPPPAPQVLSPVMFTAVNSSDFILSYNNQGVEALLCQIDLSPSNDFPLSDTLSFTQLCTEETNEFEFPAPLEDGTYYLRIDSFDGLSTSLPGQTIEFKIDNTPPEIVSLEAKCAEGELTFKGEISEASAWLSINHELVPLEAGTRFESQYKLETQDNFFTFILSDEAGNLTVTTEEVGYNAASPEITVVEPGTIDWFKPGSTILINASVFDLQDDIEDQVEAQVMIKGEVQEDTLFYDQEEKSLFGFITLPSDLNDGEHAASIILADKAGNRGSEYFGIKIDNSAPFLNKNQAESVFSNSEVSLTLPVADLGAGVDPAGTLVKISGASFEGTVSVEPQSITLAPTFPIPEGSYEVEVLARDLIGNTGEALCFGLTIDTTPPQISLLGSYETQTRENKIRLQAKIEDSSPLTVNIYNNQSKIDTVSLSDSNFSREISICQGQNEIMIEAQDQAGNLTSANITTYGSFASASSLIASCVHGPNPFSPTKRLPGAFSAQGNGMLFSYNLSQPADVKIMIFDITGTLIWTKKIDNSASGVTAWNGVDQFGRTTSNGIYPYIFSATAGGNTETRRSKIIVFHQ